MHVWKCANINNTNGQICIFYSILWMSRRLGFDWLASPIGGAFEFRITQILTISPTLPGRRAVGCNINRCIRRATVVINLCIWLLMYCTWVGINIFRIDIHNQSHLKLFSHLWNAVLETLIFLKINLSTTNIIYTSAANMFLTDMILASY